MARSRSYKREVLADSSMYIDPLHCESQVSYKVVDAATRAWGSVLLSDCTRRIEWYFDGDQDESLLKIDKAIGMLQEFRQNYIEGQEEHLKRTRAHRAKSRAVKKAAAGKK